MENLCLGCMKRKTRRPVCEHCGFVEDTPNELHQLPLGTILRDQYVIGKVLGQGGFGITYLGWDRYLETPVAIKEYYPSGQVSRNGAVSSAVTCNTTGAQFQDGCDRFMKEARTLAKLQEVGNIVKVSGFFKENNTAYIVMEYVRGTTLLQYIKDRGGRLTVSETFTVLRPVMQALHRVHEAGMIHRDISPDNIMLQDNGTVKILDFGTARDIDAGGSGQMTHSTQAVLKHGFAPMEQYASGRAIDRRADEYALCATIYCCLTGQVPKDAPTMVMEGDRIKWDAVPGLTPQQKQVLTRATAFRAEERYPDLKELEDALFGAGSGKAPAPEKKQPAPERLKVPELPLQEIPQTAPMPGEEKNPVPEPETFKAAHKGKTRKLPKWLIPGMAMILLVVLLIGLAGRKKEAVSLPAQYQPLAAGLYHTVGLKSDGTVVAVGSNDYGQCDISGWTDIVAVAAGDFHTVGLKSDGTVVAAGRNDDGQCNVSGWTDIVAVAAGSYHTVGLKSDGTVVTVGMNAMNQCDVSGWTDIVAISAGGSHIVGLKADGTVVAAGDNTLGQCGVSGWSDFVMVSAGYSYTVGLKADGRVVALGLNESGQRVVYNWPDIVMVSAGSSHTVGLKADGTVVAAGRNNKGQCNVSDWRDIVAVFGGGGYTVGLKADGTVVAVGDNAQGQCEVSGWSGILVPD